MAGLGRIAAGLFGNYRDDKTLDEDYYCLRRSGFETLAIPGVPTVCCCLADIK